MRLSHMSSSSRRPRARRNRRQNPPRLVFEPLEQRMLLAQVSWNVDADGFWDVAANWLDDQGVARVPGAGDDVIINRPAGDFTVTYRQGTSTVASINAQERIIIGDSDSGQEHSHRHGLASRSARAQLDFCNTGKRYAVRGYDA